MAAEESSGTIGEALIDLGVLEFYETDNLKSDNPEQWYRFEAGQNAFVTASIGGQTPSSDVRLALYASDRSTLLQVSAPEQPRLDYASAVDGEVYYLNLTGPVDGTTLHLANLVAKEGSQMVLHGSTGHDDVIMEAGSSPRVTLNGVSYDVAAESVSTLRFEGNGGSDKVTLIGSQGNDVVLIHPHSAEFTGGGMHFVVSGAETVSVDLGAGDDQAVFNDSPDDDTFASGADSATLTGPGYSSRVAGAETILAYASLGGNDTAILNDSPDNDKVKVDPMVAKMRGGGFLVRAKYFDTILAYARNGGRDTIRMQDSPKDDKFKADSTYAKIYNSEYFVRAKFFDEVVAYADAGGEDSALLLDSAGNDILVGTPVKTRLYGVSGKYDLTVRKFDEVQAYSSSGGFDKARFSGSAGKDVFRGRFHKSELIGHGYAIVARKFEKIDVFGSRGGDDVAKLYDTPNDDSFQAEQNWARLVSSGAGADIRTTVTDFDLVKAYSTQGHDTATSAYDGNLELVGAWESTSKPITITFDPNLLMTLPPPPSPGTGLKTPGQQKGDQPNARAIHKAWRKDDFETFHNNTGIGDPHPQTDDYDIYANWLDGLGRNRTGAVDESEGIRAFNVWLRGSPRAQSWGEKVVMDPLGAAPEVFGDAAGSWTAEVLEYPWGDGWLIQWSTSESESFLRPDINGGQDIGDFSFSTKLYWDVNNNGFDANDPPVVAGESFRAWFGGYNTLVANPLTEEIEASRSVIFDQDGWGTRPSAKRKSLPFPVDEGDLGRNGSGFEGTLKLTTTHLNRPPVADVGSPNVHPEDKFYTVPAGGFVKLDAARTTDLDQDPSTLIYEWDLDEDGVFGETGADAERGDEVGISPVFSAHDTEDMDVFVLVLRVTDDGGLSDEDTAFVEVGPTLILESDNALVRNNILYYTDDNGEIDGFEQTLRMMANEVFTGINERRDI